MTLFVVAINRQEADRLAADLGWKTREAAERHLAYVQDPPTDAYYAGLYRVFRGCRAGADCDRLKNFTPAALMRGYLPSGTARRFVAAIGSIRPGGPG